jgi:hypothetical protein
MIKLEENCEMKTVSIIDCIPEILQKNILRFSIFKNNNIY